MFARSGLRPGGAQSRRTSNRYRSHSGREMRESWDSQDDIPRAMQLYPEENKRKVVSDLEFKCCKMTLMVSRCAEWKTRNAVCKDSRLKLFSWEMAAKGDQEFGFETRRILAVMERVARRREAHARDRVVAPRVASVSRPLSLYGLDDSPQNFRQNLEEQIMII